MPAQGNNRRPLVYAILLAAGLWTGGQFEHEKPERFTRILDIIGRDYVDSVQTDKIAEQTISHMLSQLDPHSVFIPARHSELSDRQIRGNYRGLGIEYIRFSDTLFVFQVVTGGPAAIAGLQAGDRLLEANGIKLGDSLSNSEVQDAILAGSDNMVKLKVYRRKNNKVFDLDITTGKIVMNSTRVYYMLNRNTGYIRLDRFSGNTHAEFLVAVNDLKARGMKDLILDLRNNGGGLLVEANAIANEFLEKDDIITYTLGRNRGKTVYRADGKGTCRDIRLVLIINHNTASASEILAGAMQDNDRAVIIGNRSYGKGLVQEPFRLEDNSTLRLTVARYYTPSGRSIQKSYNKDLLAYQREIYTRDVLGDTLEPVYDPKVVKEFFSRNGRLLTPGGGIRPDVMLRDTISDSTEIESLMPGLFYSRIFDVYVLDYMMSDSGKYAAEFSDVYLFQSRYNVSRKTVQHFIGIAGKIPYLRKLKYSAKTESVVRKHLKAALAFRLFGDAGYSQIINLEEGIFSKSYEVLKNYNRILNKGRRHPRNFDY